MNRNRRDLRLAIQNARQVEGLEERNQELDFFNQAVAHDLKAPLGYVIGYLNVLEDMYIDTFPEETIDIFRQIESGAYKINQIVESLFLLSQLRGGEKSIDGVDMEELAKAAIERFQDRIEERGVTVNIASDLPRAMGYGPWIEEALANLVSNAIKYAGKENTEPTISIRGERQGSTSRYIIEDNGLGIPAEAQSELFTSFSRFHTTEASGLGIGLAIVKRVIDQHHGEVGVESVPGEGSTFWFSLLTDEVT
jgi:signal transduction histidine kinase